MIKDVCVRPLEYLPDEWGYVIELLREDWDEYVRFGQAYATGIFPGERRPIGGWHVHKRQTDLVVCTSGQVKTVLYDRREGSPTYGQIAEVVSSGMRPLLVRIPPGVVHAFKALGISPAMMLNFTSEAFNWKEPDEEKIPFDSGEIPYRW